jgi:hypothetical protein
MRSVITRRLSAASKRPHLPTCSQNKNTLNVGKSQAERILNQQFLIVCVEFEHFKHKKPHKPNTPPTIVHLLISKGILGNAERKRNLSMVCLFGCFGIFSYSS